MTDLLKLADKLSKELYVNNPEYKKLFDKDEKFMIERRQYYLSKGYSEYDSEIKMWDDYLIKANEEYGVEFSIHKI